MDIFKLKEKLDEMKIPEEYYLLLKEDLFCEKLCLVLHGIYWEFYYGRNGHKLDAKIFRNEKMACDYFLQKVLRELEEPVYFRNRNLELNSSKNSLNKKSKRMDIFELKKKIDERKISNICLGKVYLLSDGSIEGRRGDECEHLVMHGKYCEVFHAERGSKLSIKYFDDQESACEYLFEKIRPKNI